MQVLYILFFKSCCVKLTLSGDLNAAIRTSNMNVYKPEERANMQQIIPQTAHSSIPLTHISFLVNFTGSEA